ncbi:MAG: hypothetical protein K6F33_13875 [Bacteroidales bacterium]|nr:hypothetical protein [Bacteroidales bacterium]
MKTAFSKLIATSMMACLCMSAQAQDSQDKPEEPKGKAIIKVFSNLNTGFGDDNDSRGFELDRSYLGYEYKLSKNLSIKSVMDIGKSKEVGDYQRLAYVKNAMISYKNGNFTLNGGLISTMQFGIQEKVWGFRYVMKSFQDEYKFGSSADLGVSAAYKFANWISADAIVVNGEGYKKIQIEDGLLYGAGVTLTPAKGLYVRFYGSVNEGCNDEEENIVNYAAFLGYKGDNFAAGAEFNAMKNAKFAKDADENGISLYASGKISEKMKAYARYDILSSDYEEFAEDEESAMIIGLQMKLGEYVKMSPNFRMTMPKAEGASNRYWAYLNFYFGF